MRQRFFKGLASLLILALFLVACAPARNEGSSPPAPQSAAGGNSEALSGDAAPASGEPALTVLRDQQAGFCTLGISSLPLVDIFTETVRKEGRQKVRVDGERSSRFTDLIPTISNREDLYFERFPNLDRGASPTTTLLRYHLADGQITELLQVPTCYLLSTSMYVPMGESYYTMYYAYTTPQSEIVGQLLVGCNPSTGEYEIHTINSNADLSLYWIYGLDQQRLIFVDATDGERGEYLYGVRTFDVLEKRLETLCEYRYDPAQGAGQMPLPIGTDRGLFYLQQRQISGEETIRSIVVLNGEGETVDTRVFSADLSEELPGLEITHVQNDCYAIKALKDSESRNGILFFEGEEARLIPLGGQFSTCVGAYRQYLVFENGGRDNRYQDVYFFDTEEKTYQQLRIQSSDAFLPTYVNISAGGDLLVWGQMVGEPAVNRLFIVQDVLNQLE